MRLVGKGLEWQMEARWMGAVERRQEMAECASLFRPTLAQDPDSKKFFAPLFFKKAAA
jgi:hypothetical protein